MTNKFVAVNEHNIFVVGEYEVQPDLTVDIWKDFGTDRIFILDGDASDEAIKNLVKMHGGTKYFEMKSVE